MYIIRIVTEEFFLLFKCRRKPNIAKCVDFRLIIFCIKSKMTNSDP